MKKLKLRIAKFDRMLVVEQLERSGEFKKSKHIRIDGDLFLFADGIDMQESTEFMGSCQRTFSDNEERDKYAANLVKWITEEQFGGVGKLEIGKPCLVSDNGESWQERFYSGKVAKQLGEEKRHLASEDLGDDHFFRWKYAKPLNSAQPKIDGEIYTWGIEE